MSLSIILAAIAASSLTLATPFDPQPFSNALRKRQSTATNSSNLQVDLGYSIYEGFHNQTSGINQWSGIRFAAPPTGKLRWQAPQAPEVNRSTVIQAHGIPHECPQVLYNTGVSGVALTEVNQDPNNSEDCLYLSVYAPQNASNLPVLVWIHGGGYGGGNGNQSLAEIIQGNNGGFIAVSIQYRLGAFGFLASDEWVQSYIHLFGGNASHVTISGESAGGGAVMLQAMAYGGTLGTSLFENVIVASPYLPMQYGYKDWVPSQSYYAFAQAAGCMVDFLPGSFVVSSSIFQCLVGKDTETLKNASASVSFSGAYGTWGFLPVTDDTFIQQLPSRQLQKKQVNGLRMLSGNNALEGPLFVPQNITTEQDLVNYLEDIFPLFTEDDISKILLYYPGSNATDNSDAIDYATLGYTGPTANNQSSIATGQQQRANNIYAETTFVCPSYWLAEAYTNRGREAWKYQYSVPAAIHGTDMTGYFGPATSNQGPDFVKAFMSIWGNFVMNDNPSISAAIAAGNSTAASNASSDSANAITNWPACTNARPYQINLNETGGQEFSAFAVPFGTENINATEYMGPGLRNNFSLVNAYTWEGGRGFRCDFWSSMGAVVPE